MLFEKKEKKSKEERRKKREVEKKKRRTRRKEEKKKNKKERRKKKNKERRKEVQKTLTVNFALVFPNASVIDLSNCSMSFCARCGVILCVLTSSSMLSSKATPIVLFRK